MLLHTYQSRMALVQPLPIIFVRAPIFMAQQLSGCPVLLGGEQENGGTEHSSSSCGTARSISSFGQNSKFFYREKVQFNQPQQIQQGFVLLGIRALDLQQSCLISALL